MTRLTPRRARGAHRFSSRNEFVGDRTRWIFLCLAALLALWPLAAGAAAPYTVAPVYQNGAAGSPTAQGGPVINENGTIAFVGTTPVPGAPGAGAPGVYVARDGHADTVLGPGNATIDQLGINRAGQVSFRTLEFFTIPGNPVAGSIRTIRRGSAGGTPVVVADNSGPFQSFGNLNPPIIDDGGRVVFQGVLADGTQGVFTGPDALANRLTDSNAPTGFPNLQFVRPDGTVLFRGAKNGGPLGIYKGNDPVADRVLDFGVVNNASFYTEHPDGRIAYRGNILGVQPTDTVSYIFDGPNPDTDRYADTSGAFAQFLGTPRITDAGPIVFGAVLDDGATGAFAGPDAVRDRIIATGDPLFGSTVTGLTFNTGQDFANSLGQVSFAYTLADGRSGIAVATVVPEPAPVALLALAGAVCLRRRRGKE